jgi:hypothetical protein
VAEKVTYGAERNAFALELDCETVSQGMRMDALGDAGACREPWQQVPDVALVDSASIKGAKELCWSTFNAFAAYVEPAADESACAWINANDASFVTLAVLDDESASIEVDILRLERENLANPKAAAPGDGDDRPVAHPCGSSSRAGSYQLLDLWLSE